MAELLFEIGCEEIPAGFVQQALVDLQKLLGSELTAARLGTPVVETFGTPRRLGATVTGLAARQPDETREVLGPPSRAAFGPDGVPTKAGLGFARNQNVEPEALLRIATPKGEYVGVRVHDVGRAAMDVLRELLPALIAKLPFQKSMRWGSGQTRFVRPIHWLLALLDGEVVPFEYAGIQSGRSSRGHRFLAPASFDVSSAADYFTKTAAAEVVVRPAERKAWIAKELARIGDELGGTAADPAALIDEVAFLVEKPFAIGVRFDAKYLEVPPQVLMAVMRKHQRYFAYADAEGNLKNHFAFIAGTRVREPELVAQGAIKVTRARFDDALFYLTEDKKKTLAERVESLRGIVFMRGLGTLHDKVGRIEALAISLAERVAPADIASVAAAARLCKADLTTGIVREFPELQGYVGRDYARREGKDAAIYNAIYEHYRPKGASDGAPEGQVGAVLSLADKLDSLAGCFRIGQEPTGTADPLALRRQTLGIVTTVAAHGYHVSLRQCLERALAGYDGVVKQPAAPAMERLLTFFEGRLRSAWTTDHAPDVVDAVLAVGFDDLLDARARLQAVAAFQKRPDFAAVATTFKRVAKILKDVIEGPVEAAHFEHEEEAALQSATTAVVERVGALVAQRNFDGALTELIGLHGPVEAFFNKVFVMHENKEIKRNRLALLRDVGQLSTGLLDFARLQAE